MCVRSVRRDRGGRHESLLGGALGALSRAYPAQTYSPSVAGDDTSPDAMRSRAATRLGPFPLPLIRETGVFVSSFGPRGASAGAVRQNLAMVRATPPPAPTASQDVFGSLPNTRPRRRSAKRDRAGAKAKAAAAGEDGAGQAKARRRRPAALGRRRSPDRGRPRGRPPRASRDPRGGLRHAASRRRRRAARRRARHHRRAGRRRAGAHRALRRGPRIEVGAWTLASSLIGVGCRPSAESSGT